MVSLICNIDAECEKLLICKTDLDCVKVLHFDIEVNPNIQFKCLFIKDKNVILEKKSDSFCYLMIVL